MTDRNSFDTLTPEFRLQINGSDIPEPVRADVIAVRVLEDIEAASMFSFALHCWDGVEMKVKWIDDALFSEGSTVTIHMGYRDRLEKLLTGEISGLEPEFHSAEPPVLTIRGFDRGHRLMKQKKTKSFVQMKDSDIASQIASKAGLTPKVESTSVNLEYVLQNNQTDFEFLKARAQRIGYEIFVQDKTLYFRPRQMAGSESLTLRREVELLEFHARSTTMTQVAQTMVRGWDPKQKKEFVGEAQTGDVRDKLGANTGPSRTQGAFAGTGTIMVQSPVSSREEADQLASGLLNEMALCHVAADGVCIGHPDLRPGKLIKIEGIGERFSGSYYVTSTEQSYLPNRGYRTAFTVRRNATG